MFLTVQLTGEREQTFDPGVSNLSIPTPFLIDVSQCLLVKPDRGEVDK